MASFKHVCLAGEQALPTATASRSHSQQISKIQVAKGNRGSKQAPARKAFRNMKLWDVAAVFQCAVEKS